MPSVETGPARVRKLVVAALLTRPGATAGAPAEVLISQRREDQALPLFWEFPGGKIEPGEAPTAALAREIQEELGVAIHIGRVWDVLFHAYPEYDVYMLVYACTLAAGETPRAVEVKDFVWIVPARLGDYRILPADEPLVRRLQAEGVPGQP
jgi:8-oxo-dGTP diphosphatase